MENQVNTNLMRMISIQLSTEERYSDKIQMTSTETSEKQLMIFDSIMFIGEVPWESCQLVGKSQSCEE
jgi:hypothetical protein